MPVIVRIKRGIIVDIDLVLKQIRPIFKRKYG